MTGTRSGQPQVSVRVERRAKDHPLGRKLLVQPLGERFQRRALDLQAQVADPGMKQLAPDRLPTMKRRCIG